MKRFKKITLIAFMLIISMTMVYAEGGQEAAAPVAAAPVAVAPVAVETVSAPASAFGIRNYSIAGSANFAYNAAGFGISAKGFNMGFGLRFEMAIHEKISVGAKMAYNFLFGYIQADAFGKYDITRIDNGDIYALLALGTDYTLKAKKFSFVAEIGAGYEYHFTEHITAFAEISTQYSVIRRFDINGNIGARYIF